MKSHYVCNGFTFATLDAAKAYAQFYATVFGVILGIECASY